jgi:hypothetical protein
VQVAQDAQDFCFLDGVVAKWEGKGLQNPDHGFKSRRRLFFFSLQSKQNHGFTQLGYSANPVDASSFFPFK